MGRGVDEAKRRLWAERLRRFEQSDVTVADFCRAERVSDASFYQWRKKLGGMQRRRATHRGPVQQRPLTRSGGTQAFVPLQIVHAAMVEMHLPNGARVVLPAGDLAMLETAVTAAGRLQPAIRGEVESC
jgi:hypothetical protein